jgi:hypothetical protein
VKGASERLKENRERVHRVTPNPKARPRSAAPVDKANFQRARQLPLSDFEDAVVAVTAEATGSDFIVTRNVADFVSSSVPAITPIDFLEQLAAVGAE